ncbi:MAG: hypothetical protein GC193_03390 [Cryomorphaceae bacterium]|nr:hypothetical protein [Cryomorphaceae bacterium]
MSYDIIPTRRFAKELKRLVKKYPSLKADFSSLISTLQENPREGVSITKDCFKIRLAIASKRKGKSGGARVITYAYVQTETVYLLTVYDKGEKGNITASELKLMIESLDLDR